MKSICNKNAVIESELVNELRFEAPVSNAGDARVGLHDFTYSVPMSFSVIWAQEAAAKHGYNSLFHRGSSRPNDPIKYMHHTIVSNQAAK